MAQSNPSSTVDFSRTYLAALDQLDKRVQSSTFKFFSIFVSIFGSLALFYVFIGQFVWFSYIYLGLASLTLVVFLAQEGYLGYFGFLKNYLNKVHFASSNLVDYLELSLYRDLKRYKDSISSSELALILLSHPEINVLFWRLEIDASWLKEVLVKEKGIMLPIQEILSDSFLLSQSLGRKQIDIYSVLLCLIKKDPFLASVVDQQKVTDMDLALLSRWFEQKPESLFEVKFTGGVARDWTVGYSPILDRLATNLSFATITDWEILAHQNAKEELKKVLIESRRGNVLLVGRPGVGKHSLTIALAKDLTEGNCPYQLAYKRILEIQMEQVFTLGKDAAGIRELFGEVLNEVFGAGDVILYFDDFAVLAGGGEALGKANLVDLILPYLKNPNFRVIAAISQNDYEHYLAQEEALLEEFNVIDIKEPSWAENILILEGLASILEAKSQIFFTYLALKQLMDLAQRYFWQEPFPIKSIHLLEKISQHALTRGKTLLNQDLINEIFEEISKIKVGKIKPEEKALLINLEKILHQRIVNQEEAIKSLSESIRIKRAGVTSGVKPIGSFLFLGPTGVGKTETAKTLAESYFGSEHAMIRFDMSEFQNKQDVYRFIGDPVTNLPGQLTEAVKENPFSLILLDEIEKAHPDILNLFLQVLDEGFITDVFGQKVYFTNHILIATSNAGSDFLVSLLKKNMAFQQITEKLADHLIEERLFRAEFLNRFDKVIYFKPLGEKELMEIANLKISKLKKELYERKRLELEVEEAAIKELAHLGYKPEYGARELERVIREKIEALIAQKIIERGQESGRISIALSDLESRG